MSKREISRKLPFIDAFSGPGGLSIGFQLSGYFEPVAAIEKAKVTCETYERNVGPLVFNECLTKTSATRIQECAQKKGYSRVEVIVGGPPCKAFTTANRGGTKWEKVKQKLIDQHEVVENSEWFSFWQLVSAIKPKAFVAENVMGLRTKTEVLQKFIERVELLGYRTGICQLDAERFGVPQRRQRIFIIGIEDAKLDSDKIVLKNPQNNPPIVTVADAISDLPELSNEAPGRVCSSYLARKPSAYQALMRGRNSVLFDHVVHSVHPIVQKRFQYIPQGYNIRRAWMEKIIPEEVMKAEYVLRKVVRKFSDKTLENMHSNIYRRLRWDGVSCTMTNARKTVLIHPLQDRLISVREAARLQSFPDWTRFSGSLDQQYQQIADAVPPLLAKAIASHLAKLLLEREANNFSLA